MQSGTFDKQEANRIIYEVCEKIIGGEEVFKHEKLQEWSDAITMQILEELCKLQKRFKFVVNVEINQRFGAGLFAYSLVYCNENDNHHAVFWENNAMQCCVDIHIISLD